MASFETPSVEVHEETGGYGPGRRLRLARERRELAVGAVADALHLHRHVVVAIEEDRYDDLPPVTFTRGYIRSYARFLDLPESEVLEAFDRLGVRDASPTFTPPGSEGGARRGAGLPAGTPWLLVVLVVAVLAVAGWFWFNDDGFGALLGREQPEVGAAAPAASGTVEQQPDSGTRGSDGAFAGAQGSGVVGGETAGTVASPGEAGITAPSEPAGVTGTDDIGTGAMSTDGGAEPGSATAGSGGDAGDKASTIAAGADTTTPGTPVDEPAGGAALDTPEATASGAGAGNRVTDAPSAAGGDGDGGTTSTPAGSERLTFEFTGESWMEVTDATGERLLFGLVGGGETRTVTGEPPFEIVVGDVGVVTLSRDGQAVALEDRANGRVARFTLGESR